MIYEPLIATFGGSHLNAYLTIDLTKFSIYTCYSYGKRGY